MRRPLLVLAVLASSCAATFCFGQSNQLDVFTGPVTSISPSGAFDVAGMHITLAHPVEICNRVSEKSGLVERCQDSTSFSASDLFIGRQLELSGHHSGKHTFKASKVFILPATTGKISGAAIIDLIPATQPTNPDEHFIRADGYLLRITPETKFKFTAPLKSFADVATNQWIQYSGTQLNDGTITLNSAAVLPNTISNTENKMLYKSDYDPSAVPDDAHESAVKKALVGADVKKIPPYRDAAMQARVERIGNSLVPAYQRVLPESDRTKVVFRFQIIDEKRWSDAVNTPAGVILVPHQLVERMQNDDQLATVLADNIAEALEKDALRIRPVATAALATTAAEYATITVPVVGLATGLSSLGLQGREAHEIIAQLAQSGRVSLCLLHDAGYDINQAPIAWWLLAGKKDKPLDQVKLPIRAETLYDSLGSAWRNPAMTGPPPAKPSAASPAAGASSTIP
ncbi:MAG TPA: hypothetical protein VN678_00245 [Acidobacteriaceae bacterium]|nr:hypothetical protein [Acidobacteriaceae bacterium]